MQYIVLIRSLPHSMNYVPRIGLKSQKKEKSLPLSHRVFFFCSKFADFVDDCAKREDWRGVPLSAYILFCSTQRVLAHLLKDIYTSPLLAYASILSCSPSCSRSVPRPPPPTSPSPHPLFHQCTPKESPDYAAVSEALEKLKAVVDRINERTRCERREGVTRFAR